MLKRALDLLIACSAFILLLPVILVVAVLVRIYLGGPILFTQVRPGLGGKPFKMIKFRTLLDLRDDNGELMPDSQRITRFGQLLRASSLDELPELWNVITGEMSLVGPRPLLMEYLPLYSSEQMRRHDVRPGITGWAQINGRNAISWEDKFTLDVWYVDNHSIWLDIKIIFLTLKKVIIREGISGAGEVTMSKFTGSDK